MGESMKFLILRKRRLWEKKKRENIVLNDIEIEIVYVFKIGKKIRAEFIGFDCVFSLDFKEFFKELDLMKYFPVQSYDKIACRHGGVNREVLEVQADRLDKENAEIMTTLALNSRYVILHTDIDENEFDFLCESAGVCPEFSDGDFEEKLVVYLGEKFLIKHLPTGKTYYDILPVLPDELNEYFLPEGNMIFSEYIKVKRNRVQNVKIRELMSK